jgi:hypothetical protein
MKDFCKDHEFHANVQLLLPSPLDFMLFLINSSSNSFDIDLICLNLLQSAAAGSEP